MQRLSAEDTPSAEAGVVASRSSLFDFRPGVGKNVTTQNATGQAGGADVGRRRHRGAGR